MLGASLIAMAVVWEPWKQTTPGRPVRFAITPPPAEALYLQGFYRNVDISPDGTRIVYIAGSGSDTQLMVRPIDQLDAAPIRGGANATFPFFSPDGRWVGFFSPNSADSGDLKKVPIAGGQPVTLCHYDGPPRGATWGPDDMIVFATRDAIGAGPNTGILTVPAGGGTPSALTRPDAGRREDHLFPSALPGRNALLFTVMTDYDVNTAEVAMLDLETGERKTLIQGGSDAQYVEGGYVVYASAGALYAVRFDVSRLQIVGDAVPVTEGVATLMSGAANFRASGSTLVVVSSEYSTTQRSLVWVSRQGREEPIKVPLREYVHARISPDGTRIAVVIGNGPPADIWLWDVTRDALTRLTLGAGVGGPLWMPDGRHLLFGTSRTPGGPLATLAADGTGFETLKIKDGTAPTSLSPDGKSLVLSPANPQNDIAVLRIDEEPLRIQPLIHTRFDEAAAEVSPDGRWLAYYSNESGRNEVYVRPFPEVDTGRWQISTEGGSKPVWSADGRELFYLGPETAMMRVTVQTAPAFSAGSPSKLFNGSPYYLAYTNRQYDVSRDGQRFLMIKNASTAAQETSTSPTITVVLNWVEALMGQVAAK